MISLAEHPAGDVNPRVVRMLGHFSRAANGVLFLIPILVLAGWIFGIETLKRVLPGFIEMNPMSAVNFILLGIALAEVRRSSESRRASWLRIVTCAFVAIFAAVMECKYLIGWDAGIDEILFRGSLGTNRMAPNTAANFFFLSLAVLLVDVRTPRGSRPSQALALAAAVIALLALIGYSYQVGKLYGVGRFAPMAVHVAFCFLLLALALLCARPRAGLMARVSSGGGGGAMARRLIFWLAAVPLAIGWLILAGCRAGAFDAAFGFTLFVLFVIVFVSLLIWKSAGLIDAQEAERNEAQESLRHARDELEVRVKERVGDLAKVMEEVRKAVLLLSDAGRDIVKFSAALSSSATETASAVAETTVTVEQLRRTVELSTEKAGAVARSAGAAALVAERGRESATAADQAMKRIHEQMGALGERTRHLGEQTDSINEIIASVDDLAQQSNVLAINAAIEAANAGEAGRGFAVVAGEVRALAAQSQAATTRVREILKEISKANLAAMKATQDGRAAVEAGVTEFSHTGESITRLTDQVSGNAEAAAQISASSQQQAIGMDQVTQAIRSIHDVSEHNAETARQLEAAAQNLNALGERLRDLVGRYQT